MKTDEESARRRRFEWTDDDVKRLVIVKSKNITRDKPEPPKDPK